MSVSRSCREWHLTPGGWVVGTDLYSVEQEDVEPPLDRLLTVQCGEELHNSFSRTERYKYETWRAVGKDSLIAELLEKYGEKRVGY
ncbi:MULTISPECIES: hypothetical protein [unclassified Leptolyngbya]|uniref:hypothetical protein n=1 Tax=unclassified Leptolyngbya TaxID=2650499 RepID=UPI0016883A68|nr:MULTISPECIES: hypothetical protein [unclassified Leptolyngbya]MBD1913218.1 hypothetical protein [Leptolyngbya sp. FACHB-8]MBD2155681.1 hypothetical protein [Leptolyngbya sp. FACHB-16]